MTYKDCKFGRTGLLSFSRSTYKNLGCLTCNRKKTNETVNFTCSPEFSSNSEIPTTFINHYYKFSPRGRHC